RKGLCAARRPHPGADAGGHPGYSRGDQRCREAPARSADIRARTGSPLRALGKRRQHLRIQDIALRPRECGMHRMDSSRAVPPESGQSPTIDNRFSRREAMLTAAAGAALGASASAALAEANAGRSYGAPVVELYVPAGALSLEQKAEMIKRVTDVVLGALN